MMQKSIIDITPAAGAFISEILSSEPDLALQLGYDNKGCSGHKYTFELIKQSDIAAQDERILLPNGLVTVKAACVLGLFGSTLDLYQDDFDQQLVWHNPMAVNSCGCGASFQLEGEQPCH